MQMYLYFITAMLFSYSAVVLADDEAKRYTQTFRVAIESSNPDAKDAIVNFELSYVVEYDATQERYVISKKGMYFGWKVVQPGGYGSYDWRANDLLHQSAFHLWDSDRELNPHALKASVNMPIDILSLEEGRLKILAHFDQSSGKIVVDNILERVTGDIKTSITFTPIGKSGEHLSWKNFDPEIRVEVLSSCNEYLRQL